MQNDLISRSALIEAMEKGTCNWGEQMWKQVVFDIINNQPTAYDVEKVVSKIEKEKQRLKTLKNDCIALCDGEVIAIEEKAYNFAIGCVRNGGKE